MFFLSFVNLDEKKNIALSSLLLLTPIRYFVKRRYLFFVRMSMHQKYLLVPLQKVKWYRDNCLRGNIENML